MATKNDIAWAKYISKKNLNFDGTTYFVDAKELKKLAGREPRLLAKFDKPAELPEPLAAVGYTLLPVRNGRYLLFPGNLFVDVPTYPSPVEFEPKLKFPLATAGRGSGEAQYIDYAFNIGLLHDFVNVDKMYLTVRNRERTGRFEFTIANTNLTVEGVQIEVDAGYEGLHDIILLEAKIELPDCFNVRQLYYPYRHFQKLVNYKNIRPIFLAYDIPSATYYLCEYSFDDPLDPSTIHVKRSAAYKLATVPKQSVYSLIDADFIPDSENRVPQADDLNKIFQLLDLVDAGINNADDVADFFVFDRRQSNYYRQAAEYLGLLAGYEVTSLGAELLAAKPGEQATVFAKAVVNSWIFSALIEEAGQQGYFTDSDIEEVIARAEKPGGGHYSNVTISRRKSTIVSWLKWLAAEMECFEISDGKYFLR